jgi:hypothetical protein
MRQPDADIGPAFIAAAKPRSHQAAGCFNQRGRMAAGKRSALKDEFAVNQGIFIHVSTLALHI